jgi:uncharacterized protein (TIGR00288 family)
MRLHRSDGERILAVFIDFENLALGFGGRRDRFNVEKVFERLVEKGKIVAKKAYADWSRFGNYTAHLHESAVELIEIPKRTQTGKNSADIRMCVDAMDLAYSKDHIDTFVVVSGDSDFSPLVSKLKELGKHVIGLGLAPSTSELLRDNCDEFIYYEDLDRAPIPALADSATIPEPKRKAFELLLDSLLALRRENKEVIFSSMVKDTMKRKKPSFNEEYHGYRTFSELLEDAQRYGLVDLERHKTSGTYVVSRFGSEPRGTAAPVRATVVAQPPRALPPASRQATPAAEPPRDRGRAPRPAADAPPPRREPPRTPPPPAAEEPAEDETDLPLGRALIEDAELDDDLDEVPSYRPAKTAASPKPTAKPAAPPERSGRGRGQSSAKPAAKPKADGPARRGTRTAEPKGGGRPPAPKKATPPKPTAAPKPAAPPADDDFGAGLD